jgi:hypothetical protein
MYQFTVTSGFFSLFIFHNLNLSNFELKIKISTKKIQEFTILEGFAIVASELSISYVLTPFHKQSCINKVSICPKISTESHF